MRDPWLDNARWLAGSLVVLVHVLTMYMGDGSFANWLHGALSPARVPLFAILVGYFTSPRPSLRDLNNLITMVAFPYAVVTAAHVGLNVAFGWDRIFTPLQAQYTLWFLTGVLVWRITMPLVLRFRYPMLIAILISLTSGMFRDYWAFDLSRVLGLYPFVMFGMLLRRDDRLVREQSRTSTGIAIAVIVGWITYKHFTSVVPLGFISFSRTYDDGLNGNLMGMASRLVLLVAIALTSLAVLHLMPRGRLRWITYIGQGGFTIYLLHGLVIRCLWRIGLFKPEGDPGWWEIPIAIIFAFLLAAALGSKPVRIAMKPLMRSKLSWLLLSPKQTNSFVPRPLPVSTLR